MIDVKSPFLVFQDFISSEESKTIANNVKVEITESPNTGKDSIERHHSEIEITLFEKFKELIPQIEKYYTGFKYKGTEHLIFQQFPANGKIAEEPHCENAVFKRKKWVKVRDRDLTGILWLKDHQDIPPFDEENNVLGGKLEFPVYNFGFQPQKGTLIIYPANERFISLTTEILVGELQCVRFHICGEGIWLYDPKNYPGDFRSWFSNIV